MITSKSTKASNPTSVSKNILTWQQMINEKNSNLISVLDSVYKRKKKYKGIT